MNLSEKVQRYAEIKAEISELKSEADNIEAEILKASEADLEDTKFKSAVYSDISGNTITVTNADSVKLIYPAMLKEIFGKAYSDVVKEEITYKLSEPAKRLLSAVYNKEYIKDGSVEQILDGMKLDDKSRKTLEKKLKGANYSNDVKNLMKLGGLDEKSARENAYLVSEAVAWQNFVKLLTLNNEQLTDEVVERAVDMIDSAVIVERTPKTKFTAVK
ncbi:MAG: hypothetical protein J5994_10260 [Ruminococcus sp.]|nr:hypothetical protein [Ruminococcus sp.]